MFQTGFLQTWRNHLGNVIVQTVSFQIFEKQRKAKKSQSIEIFQVPLHKEPTWLWETIDRWLKTCDTKLSKENVPDFIREFLKGVDLRAESKWLKER